MSNDYKEDERVDPILLWDVMKMQIRASSIKYAKTYKVKQRQISLLEEKLDGNNLSDDEMNEVRTELLA